MNRKIVYVLEYVTKVSGAISSIFALIEACIVTLLV